MKLLNLGCGDRYLPGWVNVDFVSHSKDVITHNLLLPLPFENEEFDAVYSSHVLEHFSKIEASNFLSEIHRVLKPGGILRIAVPDLERFAKGYLDCLNNFRAEKNEKSNANYEWSVIELLDQMVRDKSGGEMLKFWCQDRIINEDYITGRLGHEFLRFRDYFKTNPDEAKKMLNKNAPSGGLLFRLKQKLFKRLFGIELSPEDIMYLRFRKMGELHKWMYDEVSLKEILKNKLFHDPKVVDAKTSGINNWSQHMYLDVENNKARKPDSIFMEAIR